MVDNTEIQKTYLEYAKEGKVDEFIKLVEKTGVAPDLYDPYSLYDVCIENEDVGKIIKLIKIGVPAFESHIKDAYAICYGKGDVDSYKILRESTDVKPFYSEEDIVQIRYVNLIEKGEINELEEEIKKRGYIPTLAKNETFLKRICNQYKEKGEEHNIKKLANLLQIDYSELEAYVQNG